MEFVLTGQIHALSSLLMTWTNFKSFRARGWSERILQETLSLLSIKAE